MIKGWIRKMNRLATFAATAALVTACGGGGGTEDNGTGFVPAAPPEGAKINITLTDLQGRETTEITPLSSGVFRIKVSSPGGDALTQKLVTAQTTIGRLVPESGTALTDGDGIAILYVEVDGVDGAGTLTASVTHDDVETDGSLSFSVTTKVPAAQRKLGFIDNSGSFVEGTIKVSPSGQISAGGTAALTLVVVDENLEAVTTQESLSFTSNCLFGDLATLDPPSPVTLGSTITVNFTANGCEGEEKVTARLLSSGAEATGVISIAPIRGEVISFNSERTTTKIIGIRGTGSASDLTEAANIFFNVTDSLMNPVVGARVNFSLLQGVGNSALSCQGLNYCEFANAEDEAAGRSTRYTAVSGVDGVVSTRILSGSVASPIQVLAYVDLNDNGERDSDEPSTVSKTLVVTTGVADQNSISLTATHYIPYGGSHASDTATCGAAYSGGLAEDGLCSRVQARLADKFNNPVPDGTAVTFTTEYGRVVGSCLTVDGDCAVIWNSQNPRASATVAKYSAPITINENLDASTPNRYDCPSHSVNHGPCPDDIGDPSINPPGAPRGGRSTITAIVNGEESFVDSNGNGFYDEGERWTNLTEAFTDHNEDGLYTPAQRENCVDPASADDICLAGLEEFYFDFNNNGVFDLNDSPGAPAGSSLPDGLYNGVLCREVDAAVGICSRDLLHLSSSVQVILSPSVDGFGFLVINNFKREVTGALKGGSSYTLYVSDYFNNPPPPNSIISVKGSGGCAVINEEVRLPYPGSSRAGAWAHTFGVATDIASEESAADPDMVEIKLTLPDGNYLYQILDCDVERPDEICADGTPVFSPNTCPP